MISTQIYGRPEVAELGGHADRALEVVCRNDPGAAGLPGFTAWSKEGPTA